MVVVEAADSVEEPDFLHGEVTKTCSLVEGVETQTLSAEVAGRPTQRAAVGATLLNRCAMEVEVQQNLHAVGATVPCAARRTWRMY